MAQQQDTVRKGLQYLDPTAERVDIPLRAAPRTWLGSDGSLRRWLQLEYSHALFNISV
jgi:hypothetical protein